MTAEARGGVPGQVRCANQSVFAAEVSCPGNLQTDKSKVFRMPGEVQLRLLRHDVVPNPFAEGQRDLRSAWAAMVVSNAEDRAPTTLPILNADGVYN